MRERDVVVREVGLRDGLQSVATVMSTADKLAWCRAEAEAGVAAIEVASFVPAASLPQFADAADVVRTAREIDGLLVAALVPNLRGARDAAAAGAEVLNGVVSVSEGHNRSNLRRSTAETLADLARIAAFLRGVEPARRPVFNVALATSFGCTIDGPVSEDRVREVAAAVIEAGADEITVADTVGYGDPAAVRRVFRALRQDLGPGVPLGAHFHDTRGTGLANVVAALDAGIRHFDASLGGLGGCPYAPGATGNIVTEDLVYMLEAMGLSTGIDLDRLLAVRPPVERALAGERFEGTLARAGVPKNYAAKRPTAAA